MNHKSGSEPDFLQISQRALVASRYGRMSASPSPIEARIAVIRDQKVMIDTDLAALYGVPTKALIQAVKRNLERFPLDFMFRLTEQEVEILRSQTVTSSFPRRWGGRRSAPYAFSEQGVAMLSSVLHSKKAIAVNIAIMRAFVRLRTLAGPGSQLARKLDELDKRVAGHDSAIASIVRAIRELATPADAKPKRRIGFITE